MGLTDFLGTLARGAVRSIPVVGGALDAGITGLQHNGDGQGGFLQGAKDFLGEHGGDVLMGGQIANAAYNQKKAGDYAGQALDTVQGQWKDQAPLRQQGMAGMLDPGQGIAAKVGAIPQGANPYAPHPSAPPSLAPAAQGAPPAAPPSGGFGGFGGRLAKIQAQGNSAPQGPALGPAKMGGQ